MAELGLLIHHKRTAPNWATGLPRPRASRWTRSSAPTCAKSAPLAGCEPAAWGSRGGAVARRQQCEHAWRRQLGETTGRALPQPHRGGDALARVARLRADALGVRPYDAMLALYEPGMTSARLDEIFGDLTGWLPNLIQTVSEQQSASRCRSRKAPSPSPPSRRSASR